MSSMDRRREEKRREEKRREEKRREEKRREEKRRDGESVSYLLRELMCYSCVRIPFIHSFPTLIPREERESKFHHVFWESLCVMNTSSGILFIHP
jgi:methylase of polypeptide subunit release factors